MKKALKYSIICTVLAFSVIGAITVFSAFTSENNIFIEKLRGFFFSNIDEAEQYKLAGEEIPISNPDVKERLERELILQTNMHGTTLLNLKNSGRYFMLFDSLLKENQIPADFKYLAIAESNLYNATSSAGAKGIWQIMPAVGKSLGLEISDFVDERLHPEKATKAACQLLKKYYERFGSWTLATAAYNLGETKFSEEMNLQRAGSFYDMNLNSETSRYVFKIAAIKELMHNPMKYGFDQSELNLYKPYESLDTVVVEKSITSLGDFAKENNTSYRMLKILNPWLISNSLPVSNGKSYTILVPKKENKG